MPAAPAASTCRITALLCEGREHNLFLARPPDSDEERLVVKVPHPARRLADTDARLREEARLLGLLSHPGVVGARGLAQVDDDVGLVLDRVPGPSLRELMERAPLPPRAAAEALAGLAEALAGAVEAVDADGAPIEAVHGGLTPDDVRLDDAGRPVILGWSRSASRLPPLGARVAGVPIAPSARPPEGAPGPAGDVFALATLTLELLDGAQPAPLAVPPEALPARRADGLARAEGRGLSQELSALLEQMLASDPGARPAAREVARRAAALAPLEAGETLAELGAAPLPTVELPDALDGPVVRLTPNAARRLRLRIAPWKVGAIVGGAIGMSAAAGILWMKWEAAQLPDPAPIRPEVVEAPAPPPAPSPAPPPAAAPAPRVEPAAPVDVVRAPEPAAATPAPTTPAAKAAEPASEASKGPTIVAIDASVAASAPSNTSAASASEGRVSFVIRPAGSIGPSGQAMTDRIWRGSLPAGAQTFQLRGVDGELKELTVEIKAGVNNVLCYDARLDKWCGQSASLNKP